MEQIHKILKELYAKKAEEKKKAQEQQIMPPPSSVPLSSPSPPSSSPSPSPSPSFDGFPQMTALLNEPPKENWSQLAEVRKSIEQQQKSWEKQFSVSSSPANSSKPLAGPTTPTTSSSSSLPPKSPQLRSAPVPPSTPFPTPTPPPVHPPVSQNSQPPPTQTSSQSPASLPTVSSKGPRPLVVDSQLITTFNEIARKNTLRDIETCGILAGTLKQNSLYVTHLIVPKQEGQSDQCSMTNEDEVFAYQDERDLMTLGWIHTHPSHDCFLSSVDIHTHFSYQLLLEEAVAIVVAPKRRESVGIFCLTDPPGMEVVQKCNQRGFHPHPPGLYGNASHVTLRSHSPSYQVVDLR